MGKGVEYYGLITDLPLFWQYMGIGVEGTKDEPTGRALYGL